jgi:hypothetical protein
MSYNNLDLCYSPYECLTMQSIDASVRRLVLQAGLKMNNLTCGLGDQFEVCMSLLEMHYENKVQGLHAPAGGATAAVPEGGGLKCPPALTPTSS